MHLVLQNWLHSGHALLIFLILALYSLRDMRHILCFRLSSPSWKPDYVSKSKTGKMMVNGESSLVYFASKSYVLSANSHQQSNNPLKCLQGPLLITLCPVSDITKNCQSRRDEGFLRSEAWIIDPDGKAGEDSKPFTAWCEMTQTPPLGITVSQNARRVHTLSLA